MVDDNELARWRSEWAREAEMILFHDANPRCTGKALAEQFDLRPSRVSNLLKRHRAEKTEQALIAALDQAKNDTFAKKAERLWLDLAWLRMELDRRHGEPE